MSERIKCFWIVPTEVARVYLRRYRHTEHEFTCRMGYHDAMVYLEDTPAKSEIVEGVDHGYRTKYCDGAKVDRSHPQWPVKCECGELFKDTDEYQEFAQLIYRASTGEEMILREAVPGAMWRQDWFEPHFAGDDGQCVAVMTPGGEWTIDAKREGVAWTRTGIPPDLTVTPSIRISNKDGTDKYHGWLTNGYLIPC